MVTLARWTRGRPWQAAGEHGECGYLIGLKGIPSHGSIGNLLVHYRALSVESVY